MGRLVWIRSLIHGDQAAMEGYASGVLVFFMPSSSDTENLPRYASHLLQLADDSHAEQWGC
jgi:hypothetical protein